MRNTLVFLGITFFITTVIIFFWFSTKSIISNGNEENLNIVDSQRVAKLYSTLWYPVGTGIRSGLSLVRYPTFEFLSLLQSTGLPPFLIQALLLWLLMNVGILSMYLLLNKGFELKLMAASIGSYFYFLNLYSMTQVWKRFIYQAMFPWAYLPLFIFLLLKWLNNGQIRWLAWLLISSLIFSHAFASPGYTIGFGISVLILLFVKILEVRKKVSDLRNLILRALALLMGILVHSWWIYPLITTSSGGGSFLATTASGWESNFASLSAVSKYFNTFDILLLRQSWYFGEVTSWFNFYHHVFVWLISIMILFFVFLGVWKFRKWKYWPYALTLFLVGWFISKGTNFPLGNQAYYFLFSHFPITAVLRNSYEKFGIFWLLPYAVFFSIGLSWVADFLKQKNKYIFLGGVMFLSCGLLVYPMWNGSLFSLNDKVKIPQYYLKTNNYLKKLQFSDRVFHIPFLLEGEKLTYSWGYVGEDPSENLFDCEPLSKPKLPIYDNFYQLLPKYFKERRFLKILGLLGAEGIIVHEDSVYPKIDIAETTQNIEQWEGIKSKKQLGKLIIYSLDKNLVSPRIYSATSVLLAGSIEEALTKIINGSFKMENSVFVTDPRLILKKEDMKNPKMTFSKISNDHYHVQISGAETPFIIVLNNTFDNLWQAKIIDDNVFESHFVANGFANAWFIDKLGDFGIDIKLRVWPLD